MQKLIWKQYWKRTAHDFRRTIRLKRSSHEWMKRWHSSKRRFRGTIRLPNSRICRLANSDWIVRMQNPYFPALWENGGVKRGILHLERLYSDPSSIWCHHSTFSCSTTHTRVLPSASSFISEISNFCFIKFVFTVSSLEEELKSGRSSIRNVYQVLD